MRSSVGTSGGICRVALRSSRNILGEPLITATGAVSVCVACSPSSISPSARRSTLSSPIEGSTREM